MSSHIFVEVGPFDTSEVKRAAKSAGERLHEEAERIDRESGPFTWGHVGDGEENVKRARRVEAIDSTGRDVTHRQERPGDASLTPSTDAQVIEITEFMVKQAVAGEMSLDSDYRALWKARLDTTVQHYREGQH